jgi:hypothetical protein
MARHQRIPHQTASTSVLVLCVFCLLLVDIVLSQLPQHVGLHHSRNPHPAWLVNCPPEFQNDTHHVFGELLDVRADSGNITFMDGFTGKVGHKQTRSDGA